MKKTFSLCFLNLFLLSSMASLGFSQKATDILEKMIEAQGGRKVLESIKDITMKFPWGMKEDMSVLWVIYKKEPNKMRIDMEITKMGRRRVSTQATDGETAWMYVSGPGGTRGLFEGQAKGFMRWALGYDALLHPEKYGITYSFKCNEKIEGKDYFVLEKTFSDGHTTTIYVDSETYLIYKSNGEIMSDYKKVDGVMMAHYITVNVLLDGIPAEITFTEVKFNTGLEDSLFKKPWIPLVEIEN